MSRVVRSIRRAAILAALLFAPLAAKAGAVHGHGSLKLPSGVHADLAEAMRAQHEHDFVSARRLLKRHLDAHPGDPQALLVLSAVEAATGHWSRARASCAPLSTQMPDWIVAACLGQVASGEDEIRATLSILENIPENHTDASALWARDIKSELKHRLAHRQWRPHAPHQSQVEDVQKNNAQQISPR